jgi:membrane-associated protease RseP (regulator of RpoE activity)
MAYLKAGLFRFIGTVVLHPTRGRLLSVLLFGLTAISAFLTGGPRLTLAVLAILLAHEMGHFVACRAHGMDSTWPFFLPAPGLNPIAGTLGAVMVIRSPFPNRRALFDIGIAGPLAGLAVALPVLWWGMLEAQIVSAAPSPDALGVGVPWAFQLFASHARPLLPHGMTYLLGPLGDAAWFGLLLTGLNLIPIGQFDGGHILYALFPQRAQAVSRIVWWASLGLISVSPSWILWAILARLLLRPHPPTLDDREPLGWPRTLLALLAPVALAIAFIPEPVSNSWPMLLADLANLGRWTLTLFT